MIQNLILGILIQIFGFIVFGIGIHIYNNNTVSKIKRLGNLIASVLFICTPIFMFFMYEAQKLTPIYNYIPIYIDILFLISIIYLSIISTHSVLCFFVNLF